MSLMVVKRTGQIVDFDSDRIQRAIGKAVHATGTEVSPDKIEGIVKEIVEEVGGRFQEFYPNVENVQDLVEKHLVVNGLYEIAKAYILYRAERKDAREREARENIHKSLVGKLAVKESDGTIVLFNLHKLKESIISCSVGLEKDISVDLIVKETLKNIYDGITTKEINKALVMSTISFFEIDPAYSKVAARMFLRGLFKETTNKSLVLGNSTESYRKAFLDGINLGVEKGVFDKRLKDFDLEGISQKLSLERDDLFECTGLQVLYDKYLIKNEGKAIELPQCFWMRVAMGLAINEPNKNERAIEFYEILSSLLYTPSTPTLYHSGLAKPQLSSCFLSTIDDDLHHIFKCFGDNAQLSKWAGGLGNDWTNVRATGALIKATGLESQGIIPFLKIANDTNTAINRTGRKRGATCAYLETWHLDIEDFLDLRRNTGDDRRRTHDMNTANWVPDLFMKRVVENKDWTLFSPDETPELHRSYGKKFEEAYVNYEIMVEKGLIKKHRTVSARKLWKHMLTRLFETGHPWITFKDPCNVRSPQDHCGVINSSNLCTEITLNTSNEETAVCNLGSVNVGRHIVDGKLDKEKMGATIKAAIRMLDNVIDLNFYPIIEAKNSNMRHRPIGLGLMGFQDALFKMRVPFDSPKALEFSDNMMEAISYYAILASSELAKEKGRYESYEGSKWSRGIFPVDTIDLLEQERGSQIEVSRESSMDWAPVRDHVKQHGMRNSNVMAIAPTATISNIVGSFPCIEPIYKNIYVKANMVGEFTVVNKYLVEDLKKMELWNQEMLDQVKYYDGNIQEIQGIPAEIKELHKEAFEIDPLWCVKMTAVRAKWIDQSQSHNVFMRGTSGKKLDEIYTAAWKAGLKTTYYLRTLAATQIEKSTLDADKFGFTQKREYAKQDTGAESASEAIQGAVQEAIQEEIQGSVEPLTMRIGDRERQEISGRQPANLEQQSVPASQVNKVCSLFDPDCEACQ